MRLRKHDRAKVAALRHASFGPKPSRPQPQKYRTQPREDVEAARAYLRQHGNHSTLEWMDNHPGSIPGWVQDSLVHEEGCYLCGATPHCKVGVRGFCKEHKGFATAEQKRRMSQADT